MLTGESGISGGSLSSSFLGSVVRVEGEVASAKLVFVCLDTSLVRVLKDSLGFAARASFVSFELEAGSSFRLSLASLESYSSFLALELVPFLQGLFNRPDLHVVLVGRQFSSVLALFSAARFPEVFRGVLSFSGSFWWKPINESSWEWLTAYLAKQGELKARVCLLCSERELLDTPRGEKWTRKFGQL